MVVKAEASALCTEYKSYLVATNHNRGQWGRGGGRGGSTAGLGENRRSGGYLAPITMREMYFVQAEIMFTARIAMTLRKSLEIRMVLELLANMF